MSLKSVSDSLTAATVALPSGLTASEWSEWLATSGQATLYDIGVGAKNLVATVSDTVSTFNSNLAGGLAAAGASAEAIASTITDGVVTATSSGIFTGLVAPSIALAGALAVLGWAINDATDRAVEDALKEVAPDHEWYLNGIMTGTTIADGTATLHLPAIAINDTARALAKLGFWNEDTRSGYFADSVYQPMISKLIKLTNLGTSAEFTVTSDSGTSTYSYTSDGDIFALAYPATYSGVSGYRYYMYSRSLINGGYTNRIVCPNGTYLYEGGNFFAADSATVTPDVLEVEGLNSWLQLMYAVDGVTAFNNDTFKGFTDGTNTIGYYGTTAYMGVYKYSDSVTTDLTYSYKEFTSTEPIYCFYWPAGRTNVLLTKGDVTVGDTSSSSFFNGHYSFTVDDETWQYYYSRFTDAADINTPAAPSYTGDLSDLLEIAKLYISIINANTVSDVSIGTGTAGTPDYAVQSGTQVTGITEDSTDDEIKTAIENTVISTTPDYAPIDIPVAEPDGASIDAYPIPYPIGVTGTVPDVIDDANTIAPGIDVTIGADATEQTWAQNVAESILLNPSVAVENTGEVSVSVPDAVTTGTGTTPVVVAPVGESTVLWSYYNPTLTQLNSFGAWLWGGDIVDQIKKLFANPMDAIIGIHKIYASPVTGTELDITVGLISSGVTAKAITARYTDVDCGSVDVAEYFGTVFDYSPYTTISLYLPFIGIVPLDVSEVMRSTITITYHVDVFTGDCLADVKVIRDDAGGILYQYAGNCAVQYPWSTSSYMQAAVGAVGIIASVGSAIASGGASLVGTALPALQQAANLHANVAHSGSFSGCAGAMGAKIPYLIINRPQTLMADDYKHFIGGGANYYTTLSACSGYIECEDVHLENITATNEEKDEIERLLKEGVII